MTKQAENRTDWTVDASGTVEAFDGKDLGKSISYEFSYEKYPTKENAVSAGAWPNDKQVLDDLNTSNERRAKASEYQSTVKTLREVKARTFQAQYDAFVDSAKAGGMSAKKAKAIADSSFPRLQRHTDAEALLARLLADFSAVSAEEVEIVLKADETEVE